MTFLPHASRLGLGILLAVDQVDQLGVVVGNERVPRRDAEGRSKEEAEPQEPGGPRHHLVVLNRSGPVT